MSNNTKWQDASAEKHDSPHLNVVLFKSRNKDNKELEGFKERTVSFVTGKDYASGYEGIRRKFKSFAEEGVEGELSRCYMSLNDRDPEKVNKALLHYLIDHPEMNPASLPQKVAGIAARTENRAESKWFFDFDEKGQLKAFRFRKLVSEYSGIPMNKIPQIKTINGWAIIVDHGFDTRELLKEYPDVELKRDDLLLIDWLAKGETYERGKQIGI